MICITDFLTHIRLTMKLQEQMLKKKFVKNGS